MATKPIETQELRYPAPQLSYVIVVMAEHCVPCFFCQQSQLPYENHVLSKCKFLLGFPYPPTQSPLKTTAFPHTTIYYLQLDQ